MRQVSVLAVLSLVSLIPSTSRGECRYPQPIIPGAFEYTNDFYFSASSTEGAPGEVVGVELILTIEQLHEGYLNGAGLVAAYDPTVADLLGEPIYSEEFWEFGFSPFFYELRETQGLKGFILVLPARNNFADPDPGGSIGRFIGVPINIGTVYFRLRGVPGDAFELRFLDDVLAGSLGQCLRNQLSYSEKLPPRRGKLTAYSTRHVSGLVQIVDREPIRAEPPPLPPDAKVYGEAPTNETAGARFELSGGTTTPGQIVPVDFVITSNYEFIGYLTGGTFPTEYLELRRIEVLTTPGVQLIDNQSGEFGVYATNSRRRMGAEGERVHVARLYFRVKEAARDVKEVAVSLQDLTRTYGDNVIASAPYVNRIRILRADASGGIVAATVEATPIILAQGVISLQSPTRTLRGDADFTTALDLADAVVTLNFLFLGCPTPDCPNAADFNLDGRLDITDPIATLSTLFLGAPMPGGEEPREVPCN